MAVPSIGATEPILALIGLALLAWGLLQDGAGVTTSANSRSWERWLPLRFFQWLKHPSGRPSLAMVAILLGASLLTVVLIIG